ncbi:ShlB/FhaC/HecB family hemolysin secretion/activation protein [Sphingobium sp. CR28]|uniref:ShlB/FhaC/HecB family hemolysin secretion/activation protein n=1 Tax=Sphingobium sp. CR28 TaxID=3400272 RepID=UPI003FEF4082
MNPSALMPLLLAAQPAVGPLAPSLIEQGTPVPQPETPKPAPPPSQNALIDVDAGEAGAPIQRIEFLGAEAPERVAEAARGFIGQSASREILGSLAKAISDAYARSGIALYTVAIPQQDLSTGLVRVRLAEGFVEDIIYPEGASPLVRAYAERLKAEQPLTRRSLERYLTLMRDIPGAKIDVALLRGKQAGGVNLSITPKREHSDFSFGFDNRTQRGLGNGQWRAGAQGYSLLRDGDRTDLTLLAAADLKRYRYAGLSHQTPIGSDGLTLGLSASALETRFQGQPITGEARTAGVTLSYPVIRGYKRNLIVSAGFDGLNSDAALLGSVISSDHIRVLRGAVSYSATGKRDSVSASVLANKGVDALGARAMAGFSDATFFRVTGRAGYDRVFGKRVVGRLRMVGQYTQDRLPGSERLAVGGPEFGRAFETALLSGDRGAAASLEVAVRPGLPQKFTGSEVYGFVDAARIKVLARTGFLGARYDLASAGGGVRLNYATRASFFVEGARAIEAPYGGLEKAWRVNVGWHLKLRQ